MKSILVSVMWPVWTWIDRPEYRWLFASYAGSLSVRDSLKCRRLITSKWFQDRWGHLFKLTGDQNAKILFENDKYGYRFATSVGASATGHGGDTVVCFPGYEVVNTERGPLAIGEIVNNHIEVRVLATDVSTGETAYKNITGWHVNPGRPLVRVHTADGHFDCTEDHRVWTANRGWVAAADLTESDDLPGSPVLDSAGVGNSVKPLKTNYRKPLFVERIGHCGTSYCISVSDYCTFYAGVCRVLVSNCDDPHNSIEAQSDAMRETALTWWDQSMSTRLNDPKVGSKVIVMQRLHERDLSGHVLKQGGYEHLCLPAEYESASKMTGIGWVDPRSRKGELLCPERFGRDEIEDLKIRLGEYGTAGQLQQRPSPLGGGILKVAHFQKWRGAIPALDFVLQSYDTAYTERTEGDPTACTVWGCFTTKDGKRGVLLMDSWDDHLSYPKLRKRVIDDWKAIYGGNETRKGKKADAMLIEKKGSGQSLIQDLQGANVPVFTYDPGRADKKQRAHLVAPILEMDCVYILESEKRPGEFISWAQPFVDTVGKFPNDEHDDYVDTFTQAMIHLRDSGYLELPWFEGDEIEEIDRSKKKKGNPYAA